MTRSDLRPFLLAVGVAVSVGGILGRYCPMNDRDERGHVDRFHKMFVKAGLATSHEIRRLPSARHRDESRHTAVPADLAGQFIPIDHRQTDVYDCDVRLEAFERRQSW